jgi:hypothetical protein
MQRFSIVMNSWNSVLCHRCMNSVCQRTVRLTFVKDANMLNEQSNGSEFKVLLR